MIVGNGLRGLRLCVKVKYKLIYNKKIIIVFLVLYFFYRLDFYFFHMRLVDQIRHPVRLVCRGANIFSPCFVDMNFSRASFPEFDLYRCLLRPAKSVCSLERCLPWLFPCEDAFLDAVLFPQYKISHIAHLLTPR